MVQYLKQVKLNSILFENTVIVIKFMLESPEKGEECEPRGAHCETSEGLLIFYFVTFTTLFSLEKDRRQKKGGQQRMR